MAARAPYVFERETTMKSSEISSGDDAGAGVPASDRYPGCFSVTKPSGTYFKRL